MYLDLPAATVPSRGDLIYSAPLIAEVAIGARKRHRTRRETESATEEAWPTVDVKPYIAGAPISRRARNMTAINAIPMMTRPGAPYWSATPVPGNAVAVGYCVSCASAA